jgi:hypothetical protein
MRHEHKWTDWRYSRNLSPHFLYRQCQKCGIIEAGVSSKEDKQLERIVEANLDMRDEITNK